MPVMTDIVTNELLAEMVERLYQFRLNPGHANMSFQLLIRPDSDEDTSVVSSPFF
eukprot:COSAG02_NODE_6915_length_3291_cov_1.699875_2_plen_55_part_00